MTRFGNWIIGGLLLAQAMFVGSTFGTSSFTWTAFALFGLLAYVMRNRKVELTASEKSDSVWHSTRRARIVLSLFSVGLLSAAWRLLAHVSEVFNPVAFAVDAMAHGCLAIGLCVYSLHPRHGHPSMLGLGMLVVMLSVAAGGASQSIGGQVAVGLLAGTAYLFTSRYVLNHWSLKRRGRRISVANPRVTGNDQQRIGALFSFSALSIIVLSTSAIAHSTQSYLPDVQKLIFENLKSSFDATDGNISLTGSRYVRGRRLGSVRHRILANSNEIALHTFANGAPGYLRGNVFDWYGKSQWHNYQAANENTKTSFDSYSLSESGAGRARLYSKRSGNLRRFNLHPVDGKIATVEIKNDPQKGQVFFAPLELRWIESEANSIDMSRHDIIEYGINARVPYVLGTSRTSRVEELDPHRRSVLTFVSADMAEPIGESAQGVVGSLQTSRSKARAISDYFQHEFTYSLDRIAVPGGTDPIVHFLKKKHPAHCEYFATATVLMLRTLGVPARYVTGYVASEMSTEEEGCWLARNRDAHAWVEAYDDESMTWFAVESTPGRTYQTIALADVSELSLADQLQDLESEALESDSFIGRFVGWLLSMRATDPITYLIRYGQIPFFLLVLTFLWRRLRGGGDAAVDPIDLKSRKMLARVDQRVKKHSLVRAPHETLHQFADRVDQLAVHERELAASMASNTASAILSSYAHWYREFAEARYRGLVPQPFDVAASKA